jgi:hypothetical protein
MVRFLLCPIGSLQARSLEKIDKLIAPKWSDALCKSLQEPGYCSASFEQTGQATPHYTPFGIPGTHITTQSEQAWYVAIPVKVIQKLSTGLSLMTVARGYYTG